jgi:hypothetical protein
MLQTLPQPSMQTRLTASEEFQMHRTPVYYVAWRSRISHPWRSEEFANRFQAHDRYFALLDRGAEAYVEKRAPAEVHSR